MKVIHLISGGDSGGAKTHVLSLLQHLNQTITAQLVCFRDGPFAEEARQMGIPTMICGGNNVFRTRRKLAAYIREGGYEIIHCHGSRANMIGAMLRKVTGLPVVTTVHSDYRLDYMGRPLSHLTFGTINALALRRLDYRIGVSDAMVDLLISRGFPADRFYTIYNGIDFTPPPPGGPAGVPAEPGRRCGRELCGGGHRRPDESGEGYGHPGAGLRRGLRQVPPAAAADRRRRSGEGQAHRPGGRAGRGASGVLRRMDLRRHGPVLQRPGHQRPHQPVRDLPLCPDGGGPVPSGHRLHRRGGIPYLIDQDVNGYLFQPGDWQTLGNDLAALGNDDELRRRLGEKLYEKASTQFSIQKTVSTQLQIYASILRRHQRRSSAREGVVICGAYGRGNAGDDAILEAILQEMRSIDPDMPMTVLSKDPRSTRLTYRVRAVHRSNFLAWHTAMWNSRLYINGGGSLIQDVTSRRSLWFYLANIRAAKRAGNRVQMYGCGIGPVTRESHRNLAAKIINENVDVITLREPDSLEELRAMGVTEPEVLLTADPALILRKAPDDEIDSVLLRAGIPPHGNYLCFALRRWKGFEEKAPLFGAAAEYAYRTYGLTPVFVAVEKHLDPGAGQLAARGLTIPHYFLDDAGGAGTIIGALSRMQAVVSMRLHALIFAAGQGIPLAGVVYDPKVSAFLRYIGQEQFVDLAELTGQNLCAMIDQCVAQAAHPEAQAAAVRSLQAMEQKNVEVARRLLKG